MRYWYWDIPDTRRMRVTAKIGGLASGLALAGCAVIAAVFALGATIGILAAILGIDL